MSILGLFPLLSSHDVPTRISASTTLIQSLEPNLLQTDTNYALTRLLNGLASSNQNSRQGFAVALTSLIQKCANGDGAASGKGGGEGGEAAQKVWDELIKSSTAATSKMGAESGKEERDLLFARLFGLHAILLSGVLYQPSTTSAQDLFKEVILALHSLALKKSWMKEPAYWVILEGVKSLEKAEPVPSWKEDAEKWFGAEVTSRFEGESERMGSREGRSRFGVEKLQCRRRLANSPLSHFSQPATLSPAPLSSPSLPPSKAHQPTPPPPLRLPKALRTPQRRQLQPRRVASTLVLLRTSFGMLSSMFYFPEEGTSSTESEGKAEKAKWADLWRICVDRASSLIHNHSCSSKTYRDLAQNHSSHPHQSLSNPPDSPFSKPRFPNSLLLQSRPSSAKVSSEHSPTPSARTVKGDEKTLHRSGEKLVSSLVSFISANPQPYGIELIVALTFPPYGTPLFSPPTLDKLLSALNPSAIKIWIQKLQGLILVPSTSEELLGANEGEEEAREVRREVNAKRVWALDRLLDCARKGWLGGVGDVGGKEDEVKRELVEFVSVGGWFDVKKEGKGARSYIPNPPYAESIRVEFRSRFFSILTAFLSTPSTSSTTWLSRSLSLLQNLSEDKKHFELVSLDGGEEDELDLDEERKEVLKMLKELEKSKGEDKERVDCAAELIRGAVLSSWEGDDGAEILEGFKDLLPALFPSVFPKSSDADEEEEDDGDGEEGVAPEPTTILVDLLLELLHRPSAFVKSIAQNAFNGFSKELGEQGLELLLEQIRPEEAEVVEDEDVKMAESDAPKTNGTTKKAPAPVPDSDSDNTDGEDSDDEDSEGDLEVDEAFKNELLAALQASGVADEFDAQESEDEDDDGSEEEFLDDDQMMALDDKLADIFKMQGGGKKGRKAERTEGLHYRLRVIDLLESLSKQRILSPLLCLTIIPLFSIILSSSTTSVEKELVQKSSKLLRQIVSTKRDVPILPTPEMTLESLVELHKISQNVEDGDLTNLCSQSSIFLVKSALSSPLSTSSTSSSIAQIFFDSFETYITKKNQKTRLQPKLTEEFCKRSPGVAWELREKFLELGVKERVGVNAFRRLQAFEVAGVLLTSSNATKTDAAKASILSAIPSYRTAYFTAISSSLPSSSTPSTSITFDSNRLKDLIKLVLSAIRITSSLSSSSTGQIWNSSEWKDLEERFRNNERFKNATGVLMMLKQVLGLLGVSNMKGENGEGKKGKGKRKLEEIEVEVEESKGVDGMEKKVRKDGKKGKKGRVESEDEVRVEDDDEEEEGEGEEEDGGMKVDGPVKVNGGGKKEKEKEKKKDKKKDKKKKQ